LYILLKAGIVVVREKLLKFASSQIKLSLDVRGVVLKPYSKVYFVLLVENR
jgi:hypothetical protein